MSQTKRSLPLVISVLLAVVALPAISGELSATTEGGKAALPAADGAKSEVHAAPAGAGLYAAPVLAPGKPAWVSVRDSAGAPVGHVSVLVNGSPVDTDNQGQACFIVPNAGAVALSMKAENGDELAHSEYALLPNGLLSTPDAGLFAQKLIPSRTSAHPNLSYAPAVVEPGQRVVVLGWQLDGHPYGDKFMLDGSTAETLSGSTCSLLLVVPPHAGIGPIKEAFVATKSGENTNVLETDVVKVQLDMPGKARSHSETTGSVALVGTNLPALVEMTNETPDVVAINDKDGKSLGEKATLILPGGEPNSQALSLSFKGRGVPHIAVRLLGDIPELTGDTIGKTDRSTSVAQTLAYAATVKLKRRLLGVESRLVELRKLQALPPGGEDEEKRNAETRALAVRQVSLSSMLASRRAILQALGAGDDQVRKAMDDAAGGAYYFLESQARAMKVVPDSVALQVASTPAPARLPLSRMGEPKFVLWAPPEWMGTMAEVAKSAGSQAPVPGTPTDIKPGNGGMAVPGTAKAPGVPDKSGKISSEKSASAPAEKSAKAATENTKKSQTKKSTIKKQEDEQTVAVTSRRHRRHGRQSMSTQAKHMPHQRHKRKR